MSGTDSSLTAGTPADAGRGEGWLYLGVSLALAVIFWRICCTVPGIPWNAARLAPSFALARGLPIYALQDSGAHLGWWYGPVFPLWMLPVGWLDDPTAALFLAGVWNALTLATGLYLVLREALVRNHRLAGRLVVFGLTLLLANPATLNAFVMIHVDLLCIVFGLAACASLHAGIVRGWRLGMPLAALLLALAVGTKQLAIMLVPATVLWLWREGQGARIGRWLFWLVVCGGGLALVFMAGFGAKELCFNAWLVLARMPWRESDAPTVQAVWEQVRATWPWWLVFGAIWVAGKGRPRPAASGVLARLLLWAAATQVPFGVLAAWKVGGGFNSVHSLYYLFAAGLVTVGAMLAGGGRAPRRLVAVAMVLLVALDFVQVAARGTLWQPYRGLDGVLARCREQPGHFYLPWNPLVTIIADRKVYPFDDALGCLALAGLAPRADVIRSAVPPGAVLVYHEPCQSHYALAYFGLKYRPTEP